MPCDTHLEFIFGQDFLAPVSIPHGEYKAGPNSKSIKKSVTQGKGSLKSSTDYYYKSRHNECFFGGARGNDRFRNVLRIPSPGSHFFYRF